MGCCSVWEGAGAPTCPWDPDLEMGDRTQHRNWKLKTSVLLEKGVQPSEALVRSHVNVDNTELMPFTLLQVLPVRRVQAHWKESPCTQPLRG